jgi:hypothetical protein
VLLVRRSFGGKRGRVEGGGWRVRYAHSDHDLFLGLGAGVEFADVQRDGVGGCFDSLEGYFLEALDNGDAAWGTVDVG